MKCCEIVANGYMDCKKCYEADNIRKNLNSNLYKKYSEGRKLSADEIEALKMEVEDVKRKLNII